MKKLVKKLRKRFLFSYRQDAQAYARRLNKLGARIDEGVAMSVPESVRLDETTPWMLEIGKNVYIAEGVRILTHDASWLVLKGRDGEVRGHIGPVKIGNNVFLGMNSTVLCNVTICDDVIIGAHAVVGSSIRKPGVYAGNPAKFVMSLEQMQALRESRQVREAYTIAKNYYERFGKKPPREIMGEYFWLFEKRSMENLPQAFLSQMSHCGNFEQSKRAFLESSPDFDGYDEFWSWCERRMKDEAGKRERNYGNKN